LKIRFSIPASSKFGKIITALLIIIGLGLSVKGVIAFTEDKESEKWPKASGMIIHSTLGEKENDEGKISYFADIEFKYSVDSISYTNDRISYWKFLSPDSSNFEESLLKYPLNKKVSVYYNPKDPKIGYLEPGISIGSYIYLIFGIAFIVLSVANYLISKFIIHKKASS